MRKSKRFKVSHIFNIISHSVSLLITVCLLVSGYCGILSPEDYPIMGVFCMIFPLFLILQICVILFWLLIHQWKMSLCYIVPLLLCFNPIITYCPLNITSPSISPKQKESEFSLLTYNVFGFYDFKDRKNKDYNPTVSNIIKADADIVCLQELYTFDANPAEGFTSEQRDSLLTQYPHHSAMGYGLGILSKLPIVESSYQDIEELNTKAAKIKLLIKGDTITVYNVHLQSIGLTQNDKELYGTLTSVRGASEKMDSAKKTIKELRSQVLHKLALAMKERAKQAHLIADDLENQQGTVILCGDFNDIPNSYAYRTVKGDMTDAYKQCGFGPCITYHANKFYFRIDQMFYRGNIEAVSIKRPTWDSSDHYPLFAKFVKK